MILARDVCALLLLAISVHATAIYFEEEVVDCCEGETCMEIKYCPSAIEVVYNREDPKHCGFVGKVPYVCCEDKVANIPANAIVGASQNPSAIDKSNENLKLSTTTVTNVVNDATIKDTTTLDTTFVSTTASTSSPVIQNATGSKATQQCDRTYDRITLDVNGNIEVTYLGVYKPTKTEESPHAAALGHQEGDKIEWLCAGSLISEKFVLTAAHCIEDNDMNYIRLGDLSLNENNDPVEPQNFTVARTFVNPNYKKPLRYHDISLIELDRPVIISKYVKPGCLNIKEKITETNWHIVGYKNDNATDYLYAVGISNTDRKICNFHFNLKQYKEFLPNGVDYETQLCGSGFFKGAPCQLDTGGPVQILNWDYTDGRFLIGVTAIEKLCNGKNAPGLYTKISYYIPWIESIVWSDN